MRLLDPRDQFDKCIIGTTYDGEKAIYDTEKVIETFMSVNEWDLPYYEDAPIFINTEFELENEDSSEDK